MSQYNTFQCRLPLDIFTVVPVDNPVILFLPSWKNNSYGRGHFVLAYKYVDYKGALWFKAYDNADRTDNRGWINRNWIENGIYVV